MSTKVIYGYLISYSKCQLKLAFWTLNIRLTVIFQSLGTKLIIFNQYEGKYDYHLRYAIFVFDVTQNACDELRHNWAIFIVYFNFWKRELMYVLKHVDFILNIYCK